LFAPETFRSVPETFWFAPETICSRLETFWFAPETICSQPETFWFAPETNCSQPKTFWFAPETFCFRSGIFCFTAAITSILQPGGNSKRDSSDLNLMGHGNAELSRLECPECPDLVAPAVVDGAEIIVLLQPAAYCLPSGGQRRRTVRLR
jgi:hypothetical protein